MSNQEQFGVSTLKRITLGYRLFKSRINLRIGDYLRHFIQNPKWLLTFAFGRFLCIRNVIAFFTRSHTIPEYQVTNSIFKDINAEDAEDIARLIKDDGLYLGIRLPIETVEEILSYANSEICHGNNKVENSFYLFEKENWEKIHAKKLTIAEYPDPAICPCIKALKSDPILLEIASKYFDSDPRCTGTRLWWSFAKANDPIGRLKFAQKLFHYDLTGFQSLRFFFYLTDVDMSTGPHLCIRGSHKKKKIRHQFTLLVGRSDVEAIDYYGIANTIQIHGSSGFGFAEDPYCFHKGIPPIENNRLMLLVDFIA
jgi:hypothetical protein